MIGGAVVALPCIAASVAGFGTVGIVVGVGCPGPSETVCNVGAGSLFATLQSRGATGVFVSAYSVGTSAVGAGLAMKLFRKRGVEPESSNETPIVCPNCHAKFM